MSEQLEVMIAVVLAPFHLFWREPRGEHHEEKAVCVLHDPETRQICLHTSGAKMQKYWRIPIVARERRPWGKRDQLINAPADAVKLIPIKQAPDWLRREAVACPVEMAPRIDDPERQMHDTPLRAVAKELMAAGHKLRGWRRGITHIDEVFIAVYLENQQPRLISSGLESSDGGYRVGDSWYDGGGTKVVIGTKGWCSSDRPRMNAEENSQKVASWLLSEASTMEAQAPEEAPSEEVRRMLEEISRDRGKTADGKLTTLFGVEVKRD